MEAKWEVEEAARRIQKALTSLGYCYETKEGHLLQVNFRKLEFVGDEYGLIEVDTMRLPPRVNITKLAHPNTLHHLTAVVGKPVKRLNTTGLTYCIILKPTRRYRLPKLVELNLEDKPPGEYMIGFGLSREGPVWKPIEALCHLIVAGSSDSGKSAFLRSLLYQLCKQPFPVELYLADMEGLTFSAFEKIPHLKLPIAGDLAGATTIAEHLLSEMERRSALYASTGKFPDKLSEYHAAGGARLPWVVAIFDEFTALMEEAGRKSPFAQAIAHLAMRARKYGITLVFAGQDFKADLLNTRITNQLRTRVQFRCATAYQSQVVLGQAGAEKLTVPGRALVSFGGKIVEVQTYWVSKERVIAEGSLGPALSDLERELVKYALENLEGAFIIGKLYRAFKGRISLRRLTKLGQEWERRGWLTPPTSAVDSRKATPELVRLAQLGDVENAGRPETI